MSSMSRTLAVVASMASVSAFSGSAGATIERRGLTYASGAPCYSSWEPGCEDRVAGVSCGVGQTECDGECIYGYSGYGSCGDYTSGYYSGDWTTTYASNYRTDYGSYTSDCVANIADRTDLTWADCSAAASGNWGIPDYAADYSSGYAGDYLKYYASDDFTYDEYYVAQNWQGYVTTECQGDNWGACKAKWTKYGPNRRLLQSSQYYTAGSWSTYTAAAEPYDSYDEYTASPDYDDFRTYDWNTGYSQYNGDWSQYVEQGWDTYQTNYPDGSWQEYTQDVGGDWSSFGKAAGDYSTYEGYVASGPYSYEKYNGDFVQYVGEYNNPNANYQSTGVSWTDFAYNNIKKTGWKSAGKAAKGYSSFEQYVGGADWAITTQYANRAAGAVGWVDFVNSIPKTNSDWSTWTKAAGSKGDWKNLAKYAGKAGSYSTWAGSCCAAKADKYYKNCHKYEADCSTKL